MSYLSTAGTYRKWGTSFDDPGRGFPTLASEEAKLMPSKGDPKLLGFRPQERKNKIEDLPPFPEGRTGLIELSLTCFLFPWDGMSFAKWIGEKARSDPMIPDPFML